MKEKGWRMISTRRRIISLEKFDLYRSYEYRIEMLMELEGTTDLPRVQILCARLSKVWKLKEEKRKRIERGKERKRKRRKCARVALIRPSGKLKPVFVYHSRRIPFKCRPSGGPPLE